MSTLGWILGSAAGGLALLAGSMVRIVPPVAPVQSVEEARGEAVQGTPLGPQEHGLLTVPVQGVGRASIRDSWGQSRGAGTRAHQGTDIMAAAGTPVLAAAPGTIEKLYYSNGGGGITLYIRSSDRRWSYYYAHLQDYAPGIHEGQRVDQGDPIGFVGDTGNAGAGNFHLHFGMARMMPEERWWQGQPVNPYPLLTGASGD